MISLHTCVCKVRVIIMIRCVLIAPFCNVYDPMALHLQISFVVSVQKNRCAYPLFSHFASQYIHYVISSGYNAESRHNNMNSDQWCNCYHRLQNSLLL